MIGNTNKALLSNDTLIFVNLMYSLSNYHYYQRSSINSSYYALFGICITAKKIWMTPKIGRKISSFDKVNLSSSDNNFNISFVRKLALLMRWWQHWSPFDWWWRWWRRRRLSPCLGENSGLQVPEQRLSHDSRMVLNCRGCRRRHCSSGWAKGRPWWRWAAKSW